MKGDTKLATAGHNTFLQFIVLLHRTGTVNPMYYVSFTLTFIVKVFFLAVVIILLRSLLRPMSH